MSWSGSPSVVVDSYDDLAAPPPFNSDIDTDPSVEAWRAKLRGADAVLFASPEYAGAIAGTLKNALDWIVGSGELFAKPVAVLSAGTSGGVHARRMLIQTLTLQGAHVVADLVISSSRTKMNNTGEFVDGPTIAAVTSLATLPRDTPSLTAEQSVSLARALVRATGVDQARVAPTG